MNDGDPVKVHILSDDGVTAVPVAYGDGKAKFDLGTIGEGDFTQIDVQCSAPDLNRSTE